jgi:outer membrane protein with beta-barrel domain
MFGFRLKVKCVAGVLLAVLVASGASAVEAQSTRRTRRESNANRKARIARTIEATYSHRYEVAGGGGYLRFRSGEYLQKNDEVTFFMTGTYFLNPKLGIIGDVRGMYGSAKIGNSSPNFLPFKPQISEYPFMGGVAYRVYAKEKIALTLTGEGGAALGKFDGDTKGLPSSALGLWQSATRPVVSGGANFDYNFYPNIAMRISPTFVGTFYQLSPQDPAPSPHGAFQSNLGINIGVVYRFGKIK